MTPPIAYQVVKVVDNRFLRISSLSMHALDETLRKMLKTATLTTSPA